MLTAYLKRETTRTSYYASPAGSYLDEFTDWLARCGFHEEVICQYLPGTIRFAAWGEKTYGNLTSLSADALTHFRVHLAKCGRLLYSRGQHSVHWLSAQHFVEFLRLQLSSPFLNETAIHRYLGLASERNNDRGLSTLGADAAFIDNTR